MVQLFGNVDVSNAIVSIIFLQKNYVDRNILIVQNAKKKQKSEKFMGN